MHDDRNQSRGDEPLILAIKEEQIVLPPESKIKVHVAVINQSTEDEYVDILVKGLPSDWTTIDHPVVHLHAGEARQVILTVEAPPLPQSRIGQYPLDVHAVSQDDPTRKAFASSILTVAAYQSRGRIGVMLGSIHFSISPGSSINIPILLQNRGAEEDSFRLSVKGVPANWVSTNSTLTGDQTHDSGAALTGSGGRADADQGPIHQSGKPRSANRSGMYPDDFGVFEVLCHFTTGDPPGGPSRTIDRQQRREHG